jgi:hypothetical protein
MHLKLHYSVRFGEKLSVITQKKWKVSILTGVRIIWGAKYRVHRELRGYLQGQN